ncbi:MAG: HAMP domain-containing protein [Chloroflexi bacterium]|nr:HAMP domain-containing protein [Chloroflexota bacterium]
MIETAVPQPENQLKQVPWRLFAIGIVIALIVVIILMQLVMQAPTSDIVKLVSTLTLTSFVSLMLGFFLYRRGWARSPSLRRTLMITYAWSAILILINVWIMLSQMYFSQHDLWLSGVLLLFAVVISTTFGIFVAASVTDGLRQLAATASQIAEGNLDARAEITGKDEVAQVGTVFNEMAVQLQEGAEQREELDRLRRDLIAWTSHDLRTPLTSIRALIEALHDGVVDEADTVQRYYRTIRADIIALNTLIDDLFELAQLDAGGLSIEMSSHSLSDIISDTLESFQALAEQRLITLTGEVGNDLDPVQLNAPKIGRVLSNLLSNSLRYTPTGGSVRVKAWREAKEVYVIVEDSGDGFDEADLPRIFEQFYRGELARSRSTGSAGLGLAIAHGIVEAHNGRIWAENASESGGARVGFMLPV